MVDYIMFIITIYMESQGTQLENHREFTYIASLDLLQTFPYF